MTSGTPFSRRALLAGAGGAALGTAIGSGPLAPSASAAVVEPFPGSTLGQVSNPLVLQRADTQIYKADDGYYYLMGSVPEYDRLALRRSKTLAGLATAPETVVWRRPATGLMGGHIWARRSITSTTRGTSTSPPTNPTTSSASAPTCCGARRRTRSRRSGSSCPPRRACRPAGSTPPIPSPASPGRPSSSTPRCSSTAGRAIS